MKHLIKKILQKLLGFDRYLYIFSLFILKTLKHNKREGDFTYFSEMLPDTGVILDAGANIGVMSVWLARNHPNASIHSFEPVPANIANLQKLIGKFRLKNITAVRTALGINEGQLRMVIPVKNGVKMHGLCHVIDEDTEAGTDIEVITPACTLDAYTAGLGKNKISGIKIDVENYEYQVLSGGMQTIRKHRPMIYCELWENESRAQCISLLQSAGYRCCVLEKGKLVIFDPHIHKTQNFFFIPPAD
jgi:FkbM family methyltransferase